MTPKEKMERLMAPKELSDYAITISLHEVDELSVEDQKAFIDFLNAGVKLLPTSMRKWGWK